MKRLLLAATAVAMLAGPVMAQTTVVIAPEQRKVIKEYVVQEKVRPHTCNSQYATEADWIRPPRQNNGTAFWYLATDQWRYDGLPADQLASPLARGVFQDRTTADCLVESVKRGWMPAHPTFSRNPLDLCDEAEAAGKEPAQITTGVANAS